MNKFKVEICSDAKEAEKRTKLVEITVSPIAATLGNNGAQYLDMKLALIQQVIIYPTLWPLSKMCVLHVEHGIGVSIYFKRLLKASVFNDPTFSERRYCPPSPRLPSIL